MLDGEEPPMPPLPPFPAIDARSQDVITDDQAAFFRANGLLVIRNLVRGAELADLQAETMPLVERAIAGEEHPDFSYREHEATGTRVPFRVEYVVERTESGKVLAGHPFILRTVEKLQGPNFIPTWDSMVFKNAGMGVGIPWHRDSGSRLTDPRWPIFNVDIYLDRSDLSNCLWGIPGSHRWDEARVEATIADLNGGSRGGAFRSHGALPLLMEPGDAILHDVRVLHGSAPAHSHLRRVLYYEFRPGEVERSVGPHLPGYVAKKQQILAECLRRRAASAHAVGETPFVYRPNAAFAEFPREAPPTFRCAHQDWWRPADDRALASGG
jgi:phytanoyl-CoA hydroxylase